MDILKTFYKHPVLLFWTS